MFIFSIDIQYTSLQNEYDKKYHSKFPEEAAKMCAKEGFLLVESITNDENSGEPKCSPTKMFLLGKDPPNQEKRFFAYSNFNLPPEQCKVVSIQHVLFCDYQRSQPNLEGKYF